MKEEEKMQEASRQEEKKQEQEVKTVKKDLWKGNLIPLSFYSHGSAHNPADPRIAELETTFSQVRVMLIGAAGVGKTLLAKSLQGQPE